VQDCGHFMHSDCFAQMTAMADQVHSCPLCCQVVAISGDTPERPKPTADSKERQRLEQEIAEADAMLQAKEAELSKLRNDVRIFLLGECALRESLQEEIGLAEDDVATPSERDDEEEDDEYDSDDVRTINALVEQGLNPTLMGSPRRWSWAHCLWSSGQSPKRSPKASSTGHSGTYLKIHVDRILDGSLDPDP
jgi:hypothetical protein